MSAPVLRETVTLKQGEFATLDMLHEHAVHVAETEFEKAVHGPRTPYQCPFLWLIKTPKLLLTMETPWADDDEKVRSMNMMRTYMAMANASAYSFMHEAWMAVFNLENMPKKMPFSVRGMPEQDREDVLMVWTYDRSEYHRRTRWAVRRAGTPRARLLARDDDTQEGHFEGRLFNLLKPPKPQTYRPGQDLPRHDAAGGTIGEAVEKNVVCPYCAQVMELASVIGSDRTDKAEPGDDDVMLCIECGKWARFQSDAPGGTRKLTEQESFALGFDPRLSEVRQAWVASRDARAKTRKDS